jgi:hypothetical protein
MAEYFRLRDTVREITVIYGPINSSGKDLNLMVRLKKRGGGYFREQLMNKSSSVYRQNDPRRIPSAVTLWGNVMNNFERSLIELNYNLWGWSKLPTDFKSFLFKFVHGRLYLNNVLYHMNIGNGKCTFCTIIATRELDQRNINADQIEYNYYLNLQPSESVSHIFWECESVQHVIQKFYRWIRNLDWLNGNETVAKDSFFAGNFSNFPNITNMDIVWKHFAKFFIFQCRHKKKLPTFPALKYEFEGIISRRCMAKEWLTLQQIDVLYN